MQFIKQTNIDFIGVRKYGYLITAIAMLVSFISIGYYYSQTGSLFRWGLDFSGGIQLNVKFDQPIQEEQIRSALKPLNLEELTIQRTLVGNSQTFDIRTKASGTMKDETAKTQLAKTIVNTLQQATPGNNMTVLSQDFVGASVASDFIRRASLAVLLSWLGIIVYLMWRFEFKFAVAGVFSLVHDTIITLGAISLFHVEFTLVIIAAILTNIGYSINDTIIIYDRIREDRKLHRRMEFADIINLSTNQTLSRTILTVLTVLMVALSLFIFGGDTIHGFAFVLLVGVVTGTFSSIYVASPIILEWMNWEKRRAAKKADRK
jgi:preprotein translocase subunit SecF